MDNQLVKIKFFTPVDFLEEEKYLQDMHKKGYKLVQVFGRFFYVFEKCESEDVVYRLDFKNNKETDDYLKMVEDYGWESITTVSYGFMYFRKKVKDKDTKLDLEIFSDDESRLDMVSSLSRKRLIPFGLVVLFLNVPLFITSISQEYATYFTLYNDILLFILWAYIGLHSILKIRRMKKYGFKVERNRVKFVRIVSIILAVLIFLPMPNISIYHKINTKGINKIEASDYSIIYVSDALNKESYKITNENEIEKFMNILSFDELKKDGRYKARDMIESKQVFIIGLYKNKEELGEELAILSNDNIVYNMNKYAFEDNTKINMNEIEEVLNSSFKLQKYLKHNNSIYVKTDNMTEGMISDLEVHFIESFVGLEEEITKNEECNFIGDRYQIIDDNTLNVAIEDKWFIFEKVN